MALQRAPAVPLMLLTAFAAPRGAASFQPLLCHRLSNHCRRYHGVSGLRLSGGEVHNLAIRPRSSSKKFMSMSASAEPSSSGTDASSVGAPLSTLENIYGGDFAGLSATFSSSTGELIRVPDHLVPESLIEWGQVPSCLEVLTSEDFASVKDGESTMKMERKVAAVMPEVGCGVDNLDTMRTEETFERIISAKAVFDDGEAAAICRPLPPLRDAERIKIEAAFSLSPETETSNEGDEEGATTELSYPRRVRVSCDVIPSTRTVFSPITVVRERRTSEESSGGTIGLGGGLDGRTVMRLVGKANVNKPFAEHMQAAGDIDEREGFTTLSLPGNVMVRIGSASKDKDEEEGADKWSVEMGLLSLGVGGGETRTLRVVRRVFSMDEGGASDCAIEYVTENY